MEGVDEVEQAVGNAFQGFLTAYQVPLAIAVIVIAALLANWLLRKLLMRTVTHVVRGEDHVSNTALQLQMFDAMGATPPAFAHEALLTGAEGKLSKRLGSVGVAQFRDEGIEPQAVRALLDAGCTEILLDNMDDATMAEAVRITDGRATLEASGGLTLERARGVGATGVDYISVGALTHSVVVFDLGLDLQDL